MFVGSLVIAERREEREVLITRSVTLRHLLQKDKDSKSGKLQVPVEQVGFRLLDEEGVRRPA